MGEKSLIAAGKGDEVVRVPAVAKVTDSSLASSSTNRSTISSLSLWSSSPYIWSKDRPGSLVCTVKGAFKAFSFVAE